MSQALTSASVEARVGREPWRARSVLLAGSLAALVLLCALSVAFGTREVGVQDILAALDGSIDSIAEAAISKRIPRTWLAALVGAALAVAGTVLQGLTRNPLADPGILGINTGAALAVVVGIAWFGIVTPSQYIWIAIAGAGVSAVFVYAVGSVGRGGATALKLALAGAATSVALGSFITAVVLPRGDIADGVRSWQIGGVGGATHASIGLVLPFLLCGFLIAFLSARKLNSLALGDELAAGLGERVALARAFAFLGAVILSGAATAVCGPIAFVGLMVPHLCRLLVGVDHRWLLPLSASVGACLLIAADLAGRVLTRPSELDVGIATAFLGAPFFIWIVRRQRVREL